MMTDLLEKRGPVASAVLGAAIVLALTYLVELDGIRVPLFASSMTFGVVLAGFSATQRNMMFTMRNSRVIVRAKQINQLEPILKYLSRTTHVGILLTLFSFVGFFVGDHSELVRIWMVGIGALVFFSIALLTRSELVMALLLRRFMEE